MERTGRGEREGMEKDGGRASGRGDLAPRS